MIDLADLDRRAAVVMGLTLVREGPVPIWAPAEKPSYGLGYRTFAPIFDANDCREFEQFALAKDLALEITVTKEYCIGRVWLRDMKRGPNNWIAEASTSAIDHGPTFDNVAVVLALLAALEGEDAMTAELERRDLADRTGRSQ